MNVHTALYMLLLYLLQCIIIAPLDAESHEGCLVPVRSAPYTVLYSIFYDPGLFHIRYLRLYSN